MAHANHDVHLLARTIQEWLPQGIQSIIDGTCMHCRDRYIAGIARALLLTKDREIGTPVGLATGLDLVATARGL